METNYVVYLAKTWLTYLKVDCLNDISNSIDCALQISA